MLSRLTSDLAATAKDWIIAFWGHPPYSKGSHISDTEGALIDMRQYALPILESHGVDPVLSGHGHSYPDFQDGVSPTTWYAGTRDTYPTRAATSRQSPAPPRP
jgi:hypothetical protein